MFIFFRVTTGDDYGTGCATTLYTPHPTTSTNLVKGDSGLDSTLVLHALETLGPLLQLESLVDDSLDLDLTTVEVIDRSS